jgi:3-methyladenine DNA glycosylase AlkD
MHPLVNALRKEMAEAGDPEKAQDMQAYMKSEQPFYGLQAKERRRIFRQLAKRYPVETREEYRQVILALWTSSHREDMYQALEVAERFKEYRDDQSWPLYQELVYSAPHWDTLDWIASKLISPLVLQNREHEAKLRQWSESDNMWVRRASLLAHLRHAEQTNKELLAETIVKLAPETKFFIRKAIGWVLRELARSEPDWVRDFVAAHKDELSGLSQREALKHLS